MAAAPHVVVVAFPFASHAVKLFRLARALAAAAPAATFSFLSTAAALAQLQDKNQNALEGNLRYVEVPDGLPPSSGSDAAAPPPHHPKMRLKLFMAAAEAGGLRQALDTARASAGGARVTCVVGDSFMWMAAKAAAEVEAPWVAVWTGGPSALLAHIRADALRADVGDKAASRADELLTSHPGLGSFRVRDLPNGIVSGDMNSPIVSLFRRIAEHVPRAATAVAFNTFPGLLPDDLTAALAAELPECLTVGPFHLLPFPGNDDAVQTSTDPHGCLEWLDRHPARAVAYTQLRHGRHRRGRKSGGTAGARSRAGSSRHCRRLWSLPKESWPQLPPGFLDLERGKVVPWAPQAAVLRHASVGAFVTHAGWASVLEGVSAGVPMACRPFFTDQRMNAQLVANVWGFGTVLEEPMTRGAVAAAVPSLLAGDQGIRMWERMQKMRGMAASAFAPDGGSRKNLDKLVKIVCRELS